MAESQVLCDLGLGMQVPKRTGKMKMAEGQLTLGKPGTCGIGDAGLEECA